MSSDGGGACSLRDALAKAVFPTKVRVRERASEPARTRHTPSSLISSVALTAPAHVVRAAAVQELGLEVKDKAKASAGAAACLGLLIQTLRHLASSPDLQSSGSGVLSAWSLQDVAFSPTALMTSFLWKQHQETRKCCKTTAGQRRWVYFRKQVDAVLTHEVVGPLLAVTLETVEMQLASERVDWWVSWSEMATVMRQRLRRARTRAPAVRWSRWPRRGWLTLLRSEQVGAAVSVGLKGARRH